MKRFPYLLSLLVATASALVAATAPTPAKPNIIFILADD
jgi:hypothetical protein